MTNFLTTKARDVLWSLAAAIFAIALLASMPNEVFASTLPVIENSTVSTINTNDFNFSHLGTGSDLLAVVLVSQLYGAQGGVEGVTYGGESMTLATTTGQGMAYIYYLTDAPSGTSTVSVNILPAAASANRPAIATALTITGADLSNPIDSVKTYWGASDTTIDATITTTQNDVLVLDVLSTNTGNDPSPSGTGHVSIQDGTYSGGTYGFGYKEATTGGNHTLGWSVSSQSNDFGLAIVGIAPEDSAPAAPTSLYTEGQSNPNVSVPSPEFSAVYNDADTGDVAIKYRIQVSTSSSFTSVYWDSGTTTMASTSEGNRSPDITYGGSALASSTIYYWRIKFYDDGGTEGAWSTETATFELDEEQLSEIPVIQNSTVSGQYTNDFNFSHTGTGSELLAIVLVAHRYDALGGIEGVTYGGHTMTLASTTGEGLAYVYYLPDAPSGAQTVSVDVLAAAAALNPGRPVIATALTITGADMNNPIDSLARYDSASDNSIDAIITTTQDNVLVLDVLGTTSGTDPSPTGTGHVSIQDGTYDLGIYGFGYKEATLNGNHTLGWVTTSQNNDFGLALVGIAPKAPPEIENSTVSGQYTDDFNFSHIGTGDDLLAVVLVAHRYDADGGIVGVTYGGEEMTLASTTGEGLAYVYYLANAASGTKTVSVDVLPEAAALDPGRPVIANVLTITGADMNNPIDSMTRYDGASDNTIDTTITTSQGNVLILDVLGTTSGTDPSPSGTGHTSIQDGTYHLGIYGFGYKVATSTGNHTLGWTTTSQNNDFGLAIVGIAP